MSWLERKKEEVIRKMQGITAEYMEKLSEIWFETLDRKNCDEHLSKMIEHAVTFYTDIMQESLDRRERFLAAIAERQEEATELNRLLKVEVELSPIKGLPLHTALVKLENGLSDLRRQLKQRKDEIIELLQEQEVLCEELGETPRELHDDPLPTEYELQTFREHLKALSDEKIRRKLLLDELRAEIRGYMKDLEIMMDTTLDSVLLNDPQVSLSESTISQLCKLRDEYRQQVHELRGSIERMKSKLDILWNYLEVSPSVRHKFSKYVEYTQTTYDRYYQELERCENQKKQNVKKFVDRVRAEICEWWEKTMKSDTERARFAYFTNECYTEDLLTLHEMELEDLKNFYSNNQKIFELIEQRKVLWDRMAALEAKASEPGRYNNRGGQLLKEERERKTIANKLPKIEAELTELVTEYEDKYQKKFLVFGEDVIESMARDWETKKAEKEKLMSARKNATVSNTPMSASRNMARTPLSVKNYSTIKAFSSSTKVSAQPSGVKRKLLTVESLLPNAKRSLMHELGSPRNASKTPFKSPAKKTRVIATTLRRKSGRTSSNSAKTKRKSTNKTPVKLPRMKITSENCTGSDTMSYDMFEDYIAKDPSCRSSVVINDTKRSRTNTRTKFLTSTSTCPTPTPPRSSRKLTTKNLPILI